MRAQKCDNIPLKTRKGITAEMPTFEPNYISAAGGQSSSRYRDAVYTPNDKILTMMGVEPNEREKFPSTAVDRKVICDKMLGYLLKRNRIARNEFALEFQQKVIEHLNYKFEHVKSMVDNECSCIQNKTKTSDRDSFASVRRADPVEKRALLLKKSTALLDAKSDASTPLLKKKNAITKAKSSSVVPSTTPSANRKLLLQKTYKTKSLGSK
jgi:hypothetical protein